MQTGLILSLSLSLSLSLFVSVSVFLCLCLSVSVSLSLSSSILIVHCSCCRKNLAFLIGALINLTVRVDAYFHPIRMTYPIHPGPFFRAAPNWGKLAKHLLFIRSFRTGQTSYCPLFNSSSIDTMRKSI